MISVHSRAASCQAARGPCSMTCSTRAQAGKTMTLAQLRSGATSPLQGWSTSVARPLAPRSHPTVMYPLPSRPPRVYNMACTSLRNGYDAAETGFRGRTELGAARKFTPHKRARGLVAQQVWRGTEDREGTRTAVI